MPRFERLQEKQKLDPSVFTLQGTESAPSFVDKTNRSLPIQHIPQPYQPVYLASHPTLIDQDTPHLGLAVFPKSQPSPTDHLTSYPSLVGRDSSQLSPVSRDTSHPSPVGRESLQPSPVGWDSSQPSLIG
ncbi:hypothetical protein FXO38_13970 [Capsicum annuum]|nr:hypothetical protein FXO38_13970 [Capsicum annuum]